MTRPTHDRYAAARVTKHARFIDALRECLGLAPLYLQPRDHLPGAIRPRIGDGCRRVTPPTFGTP